MRVTLLRGPTADGKPVRRTYELPEMKGASVSNVLQYINRHIDGSVAYYLSCRRGLCAACVVRMNGQNTMACVTLAYDGIVIEPTSERLLIKDSVVHLGMPKESELEIPPQAAAFKSEPAAVPHGRQAAPSPTQRGAIERPA